jgi:hypothetical protein
VPTGEKRGEHLIDHRILTEDDASDFIAHAVDQTGERILGWNRSLGWDFGF